MNSIKVGVVGVGHMGREHARVYASLPAAELVGIYDIDRDVAKRVALQHGCEPFTSLEEAVEKADAVSIATPTASHYDITLAFLRAGKHVLVEKPMASDADQAVAMVRAAEDSGSILQVGHIERFNPVLKALEDRLTHPRFIEAHRLSPYPHRSTEIGVVMDLMIHDLEIILHLVRAPIASVDAVGVAVLSKTEDIANARIRFEDGCIANITTSRISPEKMRKIRVFQDDAYLSLDYQNQQGEIYRKDGSRITRDAIPVLREEPLKAQLASFLSCIATRSSPVVSGAHASQALRLATQISGQIRSGGLVGAA
ncbi:MAG: Gfo/Idh/MocA family oxidoreductase [Verrucomicrobiia bacterium]